MTTTSAKRNLIILAKTSELIDMAFYKTVLRIDSPLFQKAIVIMFSTVPQFVDFLGTVTEDYAFSLLVHIGKKTMTQGEDGRVFSQLLDKQPFLTKINYAFTSSDGDGSFEGKACYHTQKLADDVFDLEKLPVNVMSALRNVEQGGNESQRQYDFAILTALDEGENEFFSINMQDTVEWDQFAMKGRFAPHEGFIDYREPFMLIKQKQMGMVDAALSASEVIYHHRPGYLIMGGVCGGRQKKVKMFDVIIPEKALDFSYGSLENGEFLGRDLDAKFNNDLINYLRSPANKRRIKAGMVQLITTHTEQWREQIAGAELHFDVMACGPWVIKTEDFIEKLSLEKNNMIRGLEMESYSIARIGEYYRRFDTLVVKSVMDYTDTKKEDKGVNGLPYKAIAGTISYLCIRAMLPLIKEFDSRRTQPGQRK